jgi:hypothetical protein
MAAFYRLMAAVPAALPAPGRVMICQVCDLFLGWSKRHHKPETYDWYLHCTSYRTSPSSTACCLPPT